MGLAAFNRMRREQAEREAKAKQEADQSTEKPKSPNDDLTVPQIKEKLEALNIEFAKSAKKDELLALLDEAEAVANKPKDDDQTQDSQNQTGGADQNQNGDQAKTDDENKQPE